ncbi:hypothetical protein EVAR_70223_1 [Eumeta japonica]|uniref:Uncharacterized protein n=1 Tax=Eumeta variegata TaxID=151549 RepID=A0A4C1SAV9_EUMVA|nr:hypothetical protein EVAR_70223_1 [Eumeta japonica]
MCPGSISEFKVRDGGLILPHARASSRRGYDPDGLVVMAPFRGSKLEEFPIQPEIKRRCQWVHRHHPRPSRPSLGVMVKWWVAVPSGREKLNGGEPRRSGKTMTITHLTHKRHMRSVHRFAFILYRPPRFSASHWSPPSRHYFTCNSYAHHNN